MTYAACYLRDDDEENSVFPRWGLHLLNSHHPDYPSESILQLEWSTRDDGKWGRRSNQHQTIHLICTAEEIETLILTAQKLPEQYPDECLDNTQVHTHGGYSPTRSNKSSVICRALSFVIDGKYDNRCFYIRKDSRVWTETPWGMEIMKLVTPHLVAAPWRIRNQKRKLP